MNKRTKMLKTYSCPIYFYFFHEQLMMLQTRAILVKLTIFWCVDIKISAYDNSVFTLCIAISIAALNCFTTSFFLVNLKVRKVYIYIMQLTDYKTSSLEHYHIYAYSNKNLCKS